MNDIVFFFPVYQTSSITKRIIKLRCLQSKSPMSDEINPGLHCLEFSLSLFTIPSDLIGHGFVSRRLNLNALSMRQTLIIGATGHAFLRPRVDLRRVGKGCGESSTNSARPFTDSCYLRLHNFPRLKKHSGQRTNNEGLVARKNVL